MKKRNNFNGILTIIICIALIIFGLNQIFEIYSFQNPKISPLILIALSILNIIFIFRITKRKNGEQDASTKTEQ
jgi:sulfite exporter TauE/SafE